MTAVEAMTFFRFADAGASHGEQAAAVAWTPPRIGIELRRARTLFEGISVSARAKRPMNRCSSPLRRRVPLRKNGSVGGCGQSPTETS